MIEDHRVVVNEAGVAPARERRLRDWLDEEVFPRLERPGRLLGPFGPVRASAANRLEASPFVLLWPSLAEDLHVPVPLQRLKTACNDRPVHFEISCAPPEDLARELRARELPYFSRPGWTPLAEAPAWLVWIESPLQVFGLLSTLEAAGLPSRAESRNESHPRIVAAGPGVSLAPELVSVYADVTLVGAAATPLAYWLAQAPVPESDEAIRASLAEGPWSIAAPARGTADLDLSRLEIEPETAPRNGSPEQETAHRPLGPVDLNPSLVREEFRARGRHHQEIWVGAGSARLRRSLGLAGAEPLAATLEDILSEDAGSLTLVFGLGLPGEEAADRAAIGEFAASVIEAAPRGAKQVSVRLEAYCPGADSRRAASHPPSATEFRRWVGEIRARVPGRKLRFESAPGALPWVVNQLATEGASLAPVVEALHRAGVRTGESVLATDVDLWHKSMELGEFRLVREESAPPPEGETASAEPAPTGLPALSPTIGPHLVAATNGAPDRGENKRNRWQRWQALTPRQFDYRVEFAKEGVLRFLGHGDVVELFLRACERAGMPLASSGVVQPRPKIRFGPFLPVGIEGSREYVDLGFTRKVDDLEQNLREGLPEGIEVRAVRFVPSPPPSVALSQVIQADYEARWASSHWKNAGAGAVLADRIDRLEEWSSPADEAPAGPSVSFRQIRDIRLVEETDDQPRLHFSLDLSDPGAKCKPWDLLERLLGDLVVDVRCIPLRRTQLLSVEEENGRRRLCTPMEQVDAHRRRTRARAKHCA